MKGKKEHIADDIYSAEFIRDVYLKKAQYCAKAVG